MSKLEELAERVDRLVLRHTELQRSHELLEQQVATLTTERDSLRSRLAAARARIDTLLQRLPAAADAAVPAPAAAAADAADGGPAAGATDATTATTPPAHEPAR